MSQIVLVCGAPGSGKNHYISREFERGRDVLIDADRIMAAITLQGWLTQAQGVMVAMLTAAQHHLSISSDGIRTAYVINCCAGEDRRQEIAWRLGAWQIILLDTPEEVCRERVRARVGARPDAETGVIEWFRAERSALAAASTARAPSHIPTRRPIPVRIVKGYDVVN